MRKVGGIKGKGVVDCLTHTTVTVSNFSRLVLVENEKKVKKQSKRGEI